MSNKPLFTVEDWESIVSMCSIINDTGASDEDRIGAASTLAEIVMDEPMDVLEMDLGHEPGDGGEKR